MARLLTPPSHHLWPIGAPTRPVEGHRAIGSLSKSNRPSSVSNRASSGQFPSRFSHNHSPRRRLTVGARFRRIGASFRRDRGEFPTSFRGRSADSRFSGRFATTLQDSCN
ncbi:hypothetical protein Acr_24g0005630 [Actinidia rufa]|uniref:Uncharacterized protein n=1 Tax=Actinidia rufa TaxID=165716 RepID=A0A7J0GUA3_9ERIC|nr:hypothetical protein Acr_24g0005630 [Actinidia rufa]